MPVYIQNKKVGEATRKIKKFKVPLLGGSTKDQMLRINNKNAYNIV